MYLIDKETFIKQVLPPKKRQTWRVAMLHALLDPLFSLIDMLVQYKSAKLEEINLSSQTIVLENHLQQVFGTANIFLGMDDQGGVVYVPTNFTNSQKQQVKKVIDKYLFLGNNCKIK